MVAKNKLEDVYRNVLVRPNDCWEHQNAKLKGGYVRMRISMRYELVHRISYCCEYNFSLKDIEGKIVMHTCDNSCCVNPDHLILGTQYDNIQDKIKKGRARYRAVCTHKLDTLKNAVQDVSNGMSQRQAAKKYGVSQQYLSKLILGKFTRKDLEPFLQLD